MNKFVEFVRGIFQPETHRRREPMWLLRACPEAAPAMREWPLLPEREPESRAAREREIRRMARQR